MSYSFFSFFLFFKMKRRCVLIFLPRTHTRTHARTAPVECRKRWLGFRKITNAVYSKTDRQLTPPGSPPALHYPQTKAATHAVALGGTCKVIRYFTGVFIISNTCIVTTTVIVANFVHWNTIILVLIQYLRVERTGWQ